MGRHAQSASLLLKSLANAHRLKILCALSEGPLSVGELNIRVALSQSALSQHLAVLREQRLVSTRRKSQTIYYAIEPGPAQAVMEVLYQHFCRQVPSAARRQRSASGHSSGDRK